MLIQNIISIGNGNARVVIDIEEGEIFIEDVDMNISLSGIEFEELNYGFEFTVLEYGNNEPVEGAEITVTSSEEIGEKITKTATTDSNGKAEILDILYDGEYGTLEYNHADYYSNTEYTNINFDRIQVVGNDLIIESTLYMQPTTEDLPGIDDEEIELVVGFDDIEWEEIN